jgi:hypothetical protein
MAKTPVGKIYADATKFIDATIEPRIKRIVEEANKLLEVKLKVRIGCEVQWFVESTDDDKESKKTS